MTPDSHLSQNFRLYELFKSGTSDRLGISNSPLDLESGDRAIVLENLERVCRDILEPIRKRYKVPFQPNSVFRCKALNEAVGGSKTSVHMLGLAADVEVPGISNHDLLAWCRQNIEADQTIAEFLIFPSYKGATSLEICTGGWCHVGLAHKGAKPRGQYLEIGCKK